jgi:K+-transporting ATPase KdpF subunit
LSAAEIAREQRMFGEIPLIVVCALMFGYLLAALLWPEKF